MLRQGGVPASEVTNKDGVRKRREGREGKRREGGGEGRTMKRVLMTHKGFVTIVPVAPAVMAATM